MKKLAFATALTLGLSGCNQVAFNSNLIQTTQNLVALNAALIQIDVTILNNVIAEAKLLSPYACGGFALASAIINNSSASTKVNAYLAKNVAAGVSVVAVKSVCAALGYGTNVTAAPASSVPAIVSGQ